MTTRRLEGTLFSHLPQECLPDRRSFLKFSALFAAGASAVPFISEPAVAQDHPQAGAELG
jgi:hypothetical protein